MAKDALDIPTLNMLVLATGTSDVEQAVNRVIRTKDPSLRPLILDFVHPAAMWNRYYTMRRLFYRKEDFELDWTLYPEEVPHKKQKRSRFASTVDEGSDDDIPQTKRNKEEEHDNPFD